MVKVKTIATAVDAEILTLDQRVEKAKLELQKFTDSADLIYLDNIIDLLTPLIQTFSKNLQINYLLGLAYLNKDIFDKAETHLLTAYEASTDEEQKTEIHKHLSACYEVKADEIYHSADYELALSIYRQSSTQLGFFQSGMCLFRLKQYEKAKDVFRTYAKQQNDLNDIADACLNMAECFMNMADHKSAWRYLAAAIVFYRASSKATLEENKQYLSPIMQQLKK